MTVEESLQPTAGTATEELYHTNLLRLQATQLLSESILPLSSHTGMLEKEVKWAKDVWEYMDKLKRSLSSMKETLLSPDDVKFNSSKGEEKDYKSWIKLHSDKAQKHLDSNEEKNQWQFPFTGGEHLKIAPVNSYAANGAGLTTSVANANVLPTLDLAVLMPVKSKFEEAEEDSGMIGGKDYLNGRYFDVSVFAKRIRIVCVPPPSLSSFHLTHPIYLFHDRNVTFLQFMWQNSSLKRNSAKILVQCTL